MERSLKVKQALAEVKKFAKGLVNAGEHLSTMSFFSTKDGEIVCMSADEKLAELVGELKRVCNEE